MSDEIPGWFDYSDVYDQAVAEADFGGTIVEVGSWYGKSAVYLARRSIESRRHHRIVCVDTWKGTPGNPCADHVAQRGGSILEDFRRNLRVADVQDVVWPLERPSLEAAPMFEDRSLDFVFLDADHAYEAVLADINAWLPKLKPGGVLAGHDFDRPETVQRAVLERLPQAIARPPRSWWYRVPAEKGLGLCLALNVKDEEAVVARCIESVAPHVDGVVCIDTGSVDRTVIVVRETCERLGLRLRMRYGPWLDYGWNQTALLAECRREGYAHAWIFDADEYLVAPGGWRMPGLTADGYAVCRLWAGDWDYWGVRIFDLSVPWRYTGERHASPVGGVAEDLVGFDVVNGRDGGSSRPEPWAQCARFKRDAAYFAARMAADPSDTRAAYYHAQSLHDAAKFEADPGRRCALHVAALGAYEHRAQLGGYRDERYLAVLGAARYRELLGHDLAVVAELCRIATNLDPFRAEAYLELGRVHRRRGDTDLAVECLHRAMAFSPKGVIGARLGVQRSACTWRPRLELARILWDRGARFEAFGEALALWEQHEAAELWTQVEQWRTALAEGS